MARKVRTDPQIVTDRIKTWGRGQLGRREKVLVELRTALPNWSTYRLERALDRAVSSPLYPIEVSTARSLVFSGSDRAIYPKVTDGIRRRWGPDTGLRDVCVFDVSAVRRPTEHRGVWLFPDQIMFANPRRRDPGETSKRVHAVEIEYFGGFGVPSVYQALEHSRGADYTWVFGVLGRTHTSDHLERISAIADEHGVGVVLIERVASPALWTTAVTARRRRPSRDERATFLSNLRLATPTCDRGVAIAGCAPYGGGTATEELSVGAGQLR